MSNDESNKKYLTTFQAAKLLCVSPDSILKWIKAGKIAALKTPGGHHRIDLASIKSLLQKFDASRTVKEDKDHTHPNELPYCWEYNTTGDKDSYQCQECLVFKTRAIRCYEMGGIPEEYGNLRLYCDSSCEECKYYEFVKIAED